MWCQRLNFLPDCGHLPGQLNDWADTLSREDDFEGWNPELRSRLTLAQLLLVADDLIHPKDAGDAVHQHVRDAQRAWSVIVNGVTRITVPPSDPPAAPATTPRQ